MDGIPWGELQTHSGDDDGEIISNSYKDAPIAMRGPVRPGDGGLDNSVESEGIEGSA